MVDFSSGQNTSLVYLERRFDLPTPESPTRTILNIMSHFFPPLDAIFELDPRARIFSGNEAGPWCATLHAPTTAIHVRCLQFSAAVLLPEPLPVPVPLLLPGAGASTAAAAAGGSGVWDG
mmetsp:Transcript_13423/g.32917  ORF Transcript_13423/g.32917 Transcript_13423/m.32917 type:complete len:120 (-) Transcript_13423:26-385(-)